MSDNFIPLNQSTPVRGGSFERNQRQHMGYQNNWNPKYQQQNRRSNNFNRSNPWGNSRRSNSFGSDRSFHNNSPGQDNRNNIDAYLHPSMLQDPWAHLRQENK